jgi:CelD/BcsL family acetyltransferase involved in cellulose biosynthesis
VELTVANEPSFDFRSSEYESLYRSSHATAFQCPHWLAGIHDIVMPSIGADSLTITARLRNGRLALVVPLMRRRLFGIHQVEFAGAYLCDYQNAIYDPSVVPMLLNDSTLAARISECLCPCDLIELNKLPAHDKILYALFPGARRAVMGTATYPSVLESDWVQWRSKNIDEDFQRYLDRKRRRLGRAGIARFLLVEDRLELVRIFEYVRRFRAGRLKELGAYDVTADDSTFLFYRNSAIDGAKHRFTGTYCLYLDDQPLSVIFGLRDDRRFWLVLAAFDTERHRNCSTGLLITEDVLRECIHEGLSVFDFTIGDHPYKLQFGGVKSPLFELHIPRTVRGWLAAVMLEAIREAKRTVKPLLIKNRHWGRAATRTQVH